METEELIRKVIEKAGVQLQTNDDQLYFYENGGYSPIPHKSLQIIRVLLNEILTRKHGTSHIKYSFMKDRTIFSGEIEQFLEAEKEAGE